MGTAIVENGYIKVTKDGRFFRTYNGKECKLIKLKVHGRYYYYITYNDVYGDNQQVHRLAHNLYAEAFILNNVGEDAIVMAKDDNLLNISTENLYWATKSDRMSRRYASERNKRNACAVCGKKIYNLKQGGLCSVCKQKEINEIKSIERKNERLKKIKKDFENVNMDNITNREADMVRMRVNGYTLEEIGSKYSMTKQGAGRILNKVKKKF